MLFWCFVDGSGFVFFEERFELLRCIKECAGRYLMSVLCVFFDFKCARNCKRREWKKDRMYYDVLW
jgi:hypothetical protein